MPHFYAYKKVVKDEISFLNPFNIISSFYFLIKVAKKSQYLGILGLFTFFYKNIIVFYIEVRNRF